MVKEEGHELRQDLLHYYFIQIYTSIFFTYCFQNKVNVVPDFRSDYFFFGGGGIHEQDLN